MAVKYVPFLDALRVIAAFGVVLLHVVVAQVTAYGSIPLVQWDIAVFISSLTRWTIPVFVMVSGAVLLPKRKESGSEFFRKRLDRLGIPLLIWFAIYALYNTIVYGTPFTILYLVRQAVFNQPYEHLYFLVILLELALITPTLRARLPHMSQRKMAVGLALLFLSSFLWRDSRFIGFLALPYVSFYIAGYVLRSIDTSSWTAAAGVTFLCSVTATAVFTHILTTTGVTDNLYFLSFHNPLTALSALSIFIFVKMLKFSGAVRRLAPLTMGIYLVHLLVLYGVHAVINETDARYLFFSPLIALAVFGVSALIVSACRDIPVLRRVFGFSG